MSAFLSPVETIRRTAEVNYMSGRGVVVLLTYFAEIEVTWTFGCRPVSVCEQSWNWISIWRQGRTYVLGNQSRDPVIY
jgi:hypothetical protein